MYNAFSASLATKKNANDLLLAGMYDADKKKVAKFL